MPSMRVSIRLVILLCVFMMASLALAGKMVRIKNYAELNKALDEGRVVRVVVHYKKTKLVIDGKEEPAPDATGGTQIDTWERFAKGLIGPQAWVACSHTVLIAHPRHGHVYNYVRFRFYDDGKVQILARYLMPTDFKIVMDETFTSKIDTGDGKEGVELYLEK